MPMASVTSSNSRSDQPRLVGSGRLWQRYGKTIGRPRLPWMRKNTDLSHHIPKSELNHGSQDRNVSSPSLCNHATGDDEMDYSIMKDIGIDTFPDISTQPLYATSPSYLRSTQRLHDILEEISQTEEKRLLETLQMRDRQRSMRGRAQSKLDTERELPPLPNRSSSMSRYELASITKASYVIPDLGYSQRRSAAFATFPRAFELSCQDPRTMIKSPDPQRHEAPWAPLDVPTTPLRGNIRSLNRKCSFSNGSLFRPMPERRESESSISSVDIGSQRSSTTLVELDAWPGAQLVELPAEIDALTISSPHMQQTSAYGDKKFRTLPGEAFPLC